MKTPTYYIKMDPTYRGSMQRQESEDLLRDKANGTYLIRDSSYAGKFSLSVKTPKGIEHALIEIDPLRQGSTETVPVMVAEFKQLLGLAQMIPLNKF